MTNLAYLDGARPLALPNKRSNTEPYGQAPHSAGILRLVQPPLLNWSGAVLALLLIPGPVRAADKSVADMTHQELEVYLGKGKQSQLAPVIAAARDPKNKNASSKAAELYSRIRSLTIFDAVEVPVLLESMADPAVCQDIQKATADERDPSHCRVALLDALGLIGPAAQAAAAPLTAHLSDEFLRCHAAFALGKIKPTPSPVPALTASLRAGNECAIDALGDLGTASKGAVPLLASLLKNKDFTHKDRVAAALMAINTPGTAAAVDEYRRQEALAAKDQPSFAKAVLTAAGKCKVAEDALAHVKSGTPEYDAAYSSGQKICLIFNDEYAAFVRSYGGGALPYLWRYCGENYAPKPCAAMRQWIETHP